MPPDPPRWCALHAQSFRPPSFFHTPNSPPPLAKFLYTALCMYSNIHHTVCTVLSTHHYTWCNILTFGDHLYILLSIQYRCVCVSEDSQGTNGESEGGKSTPFQKIHS